jgi:hypothetical protein
MKVRGADVAKGIPQRADEGAECAMALRLSFRFVRHVRHTTTNRTESSLLSGSDETNQLIHARDVRKLDNTFSVFNEPSIEIRNQAILISAGMHLKSTLSVMGSL